MTQLMSQEAAEQTKRSTRLLRTTSLRTPIDSHARVMVHNGSDKGSTQTDDPSQDLGSGDTGFFDSPEDYGKWRRWLPAAWLGRFYLGDGREGGGCGED